MGFYQDFDCQSGVCPNCQDNCVEIAEQPIWATDQGEIYEITCPVCGVVDTFVEFVDNEEADFWAVFSGFHQIQFETIRNVANAIWE